MQPRRFKYVFTFFFIALHLAVIQGFFFFSWDALIVGSVLYFLAQFGLSAGFHRGLAHVSFMAPRWVMYVLVTLGTFTLLGGPISWVGMHQAHHKHSDTPLDPHSSTRGFWWAHIGWAFFTTQDFYRQRARKPVREDLYYRFLDRYYAVPLVVLTLLLWIVGGWTYVVWGVFMRLPLHWHATFCVNSVAHWFGYRNYVIDGNDRSRNNWWVSILTLGEGWHNNHHHDKRAAYYGRRWWEVDVVGCGIYVMGFFRLVDRIVPSRSNNAS